MFNTFARCLFVLASSVISASAYAQVAMPVSPAPSGAPVAMPLGGVTCGELRDILTGQVMKNSCTGMVKVGGYSWYFGADGESCDTVCAARGGYNDATRTYAGSDGTDANCSNVATGFGLPTATAGGSAIGIGCFYTPTGGGTVRRATAATTSSSSSNSSVRRFCACNS